MSDEKTFFVVSALRNDSGPLGCLKRFDTEKEAINHAKYVIGRRESEGQPSIGFYILKIETYVVPAKTPIKVVKLKNGRRK